MRPPSSRPPHWHALAAAAALGLLPAAAQADAGDVINYSLGAAVTTDSNLFRLAPGIDPLTTIGSADPSDTLTTTSFGLSADKQIGIQRLKLDMRLSNVRYRQFRRLDNDNHELSANWAWAVGRLLHGELSSSRRTALSGFDESASLGRNINTATTHGGSIYLRVTPDWELFATLAQNDSANSAAERQAASYGSHSADHGLRYNAPAGHQLSLRRRQIRSAQVRQDELNASVVWAPSAITRLAGDLGRVQRHTENGAAPDSSGATGHLSLDRQLSPKTRLNLAARQDVTAAASNFSTSTVVRGGVLAVSWAPTVKTALHLALDRSAIRYGNDPTTALAAREDRLRSTALTLSYRPHRSLALSLALRDEARDSNIASFAYRDRVATASAQFAF